MNFIVFWMIMAIMFWVLLALAIVSLMSWVYCQVQYYKWDRDDRIKNDIVKEVADKVGELLDEENNLGGGN